MAKAPRPLGPTEVRALREHGNSYPPEYQKAEGAIYDVPDDTSRASLVAEGLVEVAEAAAAAD